MSEKFLYDATDVHKIYDASRQLPHETLDLWLNAISSSIKKPIHNIADIGCGTGRFSVPLAKKFNTMVYGIEPSEKMLSVAYERDKDVTEVKYLKGDAENIPLDNGEVSMVFMSMVYHHLFSIDTAIKEIKRILSENGYVVIRNATQENINENKMFDYFPTAKKKELARMPSQKSVIRDFISNNFHLISNRVLNQVFAYNYQEYYEKIAKRALSVFNTISDEEFETGLKIFHEFCQNQSSNQKVYEKFHLFIFQKKGDG